MTLNEACDKLRSHIETWYDERKKEQKSIYPLELYDAKMAFMENNPDCREFEFDIHC
jgi:hypothetical protein